MDKSGELIDDLKSTGALLDGHFILSSGLHSPRYIQCARLLQHPALVEKYAGFLASAFNPGDVEVVIGPALGGVILGYEMARQLGAKSLFTERGENGKMLLRRGFKINAGEKILVAEDVITTGKSTEEVIEIIKKEGGSLAGVACLIDRAGSFDPGVKTSAVARIDVTSYPAGSCPLCEAKVPAEKPGSGGGRIL